MKKKKQILVFDDDYKRTERWSDKLKEFSYIDRDFDIRYTLYEVLGGVV